MFQVKQTAKVLSLPTRNFNECSQELKEIVYFSIIRSILEYISAVWDPDLKGHIKEPGTKKSSTIHHT